MAENEIPLEITAETKSAEKSLEDFIKAIQKATQGLDKQFKDIDKGVKETGVAVKRTKDSFIGFGNAIKTAFGAAIAFIAGRELIQAFDRAIDAASESDQAIAKLNLSLASTGEFSDEASLSLQEYASSIQKTTTLSDEAVLAGISLAKTFGITNEQARNLVDAAIDLSAATGTDLDSAIQTLGKSLTGTARELKKLGPEFAGLTEQQLKSGAAIDLVSKRFDGFAASLTQTFGGAIGQLKNNFDDVFESVGKIITQNPVVIATINLLSKTFSELSKFIEENKDALSNSLSNALKATLNLVLGFVKGLANIVRGFEILGDEVNKVGDFFTNLKNKLFGQKDANEGLLKQVNKVKEGYISAGDKILKFSGELENQIRIISKIDNNAKPATKAINNLGDAFKNTAGQSKELDKVKGSFDKIKNAIEPLQDEINKQILSVEELFKVEKERAKKLVENAEKELQFTGDLTEENKKLLQQYKDLIEQKGKLSQEIKLKTTDLSGIFSGGLFSGFGKILEAQTESGVDIEIKDKKKFAKETGTAIASAVGQGILSAVETFGDLMKGIITGEFLNSALTFAKEVASFPDTLLTIARDFDGIFKDLAKALPDVISAVINKLPNIFTSIVDSLGNIITELTNRMPEIINSLIDGLNKFIDLFIKTAPEFAKSLANGLAELIDSILARIPELIQAGGEALGNIVSVLFQRVIPNIIKALPTISREFLKSFVSNFSIILKAVPEIINAIAGQAGGFTKSILDFLPDIIEVLADNADEISLAMVEGLIGSSGDVVAALIDSLLVEGGLERIIGAILRSIPKVIVAIVQGVFRGLSKGLSAIGQAIGRAFLAAAANVSQYRFASIDELKASFQTFLEKLNNIFTNAQGGFTSAFSNIGPKIQEGFSLAGDSFSEKIKLALTGGAEILLTRIREILPEVFNSLSERIRSAFSSAATRLRDAISAPFKAFTDFLSSFKFPEPGEAAKKLKLPKFASGGLVPEGFPNDTFPARLTSGELIIPKDLVSSLSAFLSTQDRPTNEGSSDLNSALLAKIANLLAEPMQVHTSAEVNGRALANIILELSRNNARLSA